MFRFSRLTLISSLALGCVCTASGTPRTMRLDYFHSGSQSTELFSVDRVVLEPLPWPGNPVKPVDTTNRGTYFFEIRELSTDRVLYSRGYSSIYAEWVTTDEAKTANRTFHESLRFPAPDTAVRIVVEKRDVQNRFREVWSISIDPKDKSIDTSSPSPVPHVIELQKTGDPSARVDLLFLGEGYTFVEQEKCERDIRRLVDGMFSYAPFKEQRSRFNLWAICSASPDSGVSHPLSGIHRNTLYGSQFDVFGEDRYALSFDNRAIRRMASFAPYDFLAIVMNEREYGNGGIFGMYASVSIDYPAAIQVFVHEFGHHFAGLGDEYYFSANVAYAPANLSIEPWEPNVTALREPSKVKWQALVSPATPIPTPWPKQQYEDGVRESQKKIQKLREDGRAQSEIQEARRLAREAQEQALTSGDYADKVGAFAGAMYEDGYYRPQQRCIMISGPSFCAVCRHAIEEIIELYSQH